MNKRTFDIYIIGPLSRPDDMKKAALYYLRHDYSVKMLTVNTTIGECFESIDRCSIVVVATESGIYALRLLKKLEVIFKKQQARWLPWQL